jgi:hypothetical protein
LEVLYPLGEDQIEEAELLPGLPNDLVMKFVWPKLENIWRKPKEVDDDSRREAIQLMRNLHGINTSGIITRKKKIIHIEDDHDPLGLSMIEVNVAIIDALSESLSFEKRANF